MRVIYCSTFGLRSFLAVSAPLLRNTNPSAPTKQCRLDDFFRSSFLFLGLPSWRGRGALLTENDWEWLGTPGNGWEARQQDDETAGPRDYETTRPRDCETTRPRDHGTTGRRDCGTTRLRDNKATRRRGYTSAKNAGIARNIPKSRSLEVS